MFLTNNTLSSQDVAHCMFSPNQQRLIIAGKQLGEEEDICGRHP
jgi:hypothetical protein